LLADRELGPDNHCDDLPPAPCQSHFPTGLHADREVGLSNQRSEPLAAPCLFRGQNLVFDGRGAAGGARRRTGAVGELTEAAWGGERVSSGGRASGVGKGVARSAEGAARGRDGAVRYLEGAAGVGESGGATSGGWRLGIDCLAGCAPDGTPLPPLAACYGCGAAKADYTAGVRCLRCRTRLLACTGGCAARTFTCERCEEQGLGR
jgi:hypothetical protein